MPSEAAIKAIGVALALIVVLGIFAVPLSYHQVPEGHVGVEKEWGAVSGNVVEPGANWFVPVQDSVQDVEVRPRTYTMSNTQGEGQQSRADAITVKTVNGSSVDVDVTVRYRIEADSADTFVAEWNNEQQLEKRLIRPTIRTVLRDEASRLQTTGSNAIYTQDGRASLEEAALEALGDEFENEPVMLEEVQIRNIDLPKSIDQALDEKEEAKQRVEVEQQRVKQEEQKKQQRIVQAEADAAEVRIAAEADAEATRIRGEALEEHPIVLEQQAIEALKEGKAIYVPVGDGSGLTLTRQTGADTNSTAP